MSFKRILTVSVSLISLSVAAEAQTPPAAIPTPPAMPAAQAPAPAAAMPKPMAVAPAPTGVTRQELPALIKETLMNDPDIIMQAIQKLREKQADEAKQKVSEGLSKNKDEIFNDANSPTIGDVKNADVTLVDFFDYHCGYCRHMLPELTKVMNEDKKLKVVFKEFPILGEDSVAASRWALAVHRIAKDKYFDFHSALMKHEGRFEEKAVLDIAKKLGIDGGKLKAEAAKPEVSAIIDKNRALGEALGVHGTPAIIIGNEFMPGAMKYDDIKKAVEKARGGKKDDAAAPAAPAPAAKPTAPAAPAAEKPAAPAAPAVAVPTTPPAGEKPAAPVAPTAPTAPTPPAPTGGEGK